MEISKRYSVELNKIANHLIDLEKVVYTKLPKRLEHHRVRLWLNTLEKILQIC